MRRAPWFGLLFCMLSATSYGADERWMVVARDAEMQEVRSLALALATAGADPEVERAAAALIVALRDTPQELGEVDAATLDVRVERAREAWLRGQHEVALRWVDAVRSDPVAAALHDEIAEDYVMRSIEVLGHEYLAARRGAREGRSAQLHQVRSALSDLLRRFPSSMYVPDLERYLERVERELESLG